LGDDDLARLVDRALAESPQSRLAMARVAQSRALARQSRAGQYPRLDAELSASRQRQVLAFPADAFGNAPGAPQGAVPETFEIGLYSARLVGTYEPDFFGRAGDEVRAREAEAEVSRIGVEEAHLSLAAEVSEAWFELIETRARTSLLQRQLEASRARLELMRDLYEHGLSRSLEVYQQRREVATALARLATVVGAEQVVKSRLSALVGVPYDKLRITAGTELPEPEPLREVGIPAEVVFHRPEVRAARQRLEAADRRVGAALAERLPSLRLQGTLGYGSREVQQLFDHVIWSVAATVTQPLWHGGEIDAAVEQGRALLEERVAEYRDAVLQATAQVESALAALQQARAELEALEAEVEVAQETLLESELLYQQGLADFLSVVDAERSLHAAQIERLRARRAWLSARVRLHQALGGDVQRGATAANSERRDGLDP
jgi:NodT family efflux transporter outer membrane factor (OMF) lipoprotein